MSVVDGKFSQGKLHFKKDHRPFFINFKYRKYLLTQLQPTNSQHNYYK